MKIQIILTLFLFSILAGLAISASVRPIKHQDLKDQGRSLARVDATLKSYLGNPLTGLVYAASLAIGAISILAMYESPLSPLPVPSLPKPPVGRFPPENPSWPPIPKNPLKLKSANMPYAASQINPVYAIAPSYQNDPKSSAEENQWLGAQNMVSSYPNAPRRSDHVHAAQLQSYINHMSRLPVIRSKSAAVTSVSPTTASPVPSISTESSPSSSSGVAAPVMNPSDAS